MPAGELVRDLRYALRALRARLAYTFTSVVTLGIAISSVAAIFSAVNAVLLRPLPFRAPEQIVLLWTEDSTKNLRQGRSSYWSVEQWRRHNTTFTELAIADPASVTRMTPRGAERISVARMSPEFFPLFGVQPVRGRLFTRDEADHRQRVAMISDRYWQAAYDRSPEAIGTLIEIDGYRSQIIGVLPPGMESIRLDADVWEPHTLLPDWERARKMGGAQTWVVFGRLRDGIGYERAQHEMNALAQQIESPPGAERGITVVPLSLHVVGPRSRLALWSLASAVVCLLLIAVANVANLSLARSISRTRELAVRAALGASTWRIGRQLIVESIALAGVGGLLGIWMSVAAIEFIRTFATGELPRLSEANLDLRVLGCVVALSLLTGIVLGVVPTVTLLPRRGNLAMSEGGRTVSGSKAAGTLRRAFVVS